MDLEIKTHNETKIYAKLWSDIIFVFRCLLNLISSVLRVLVRIPMRAIALWALALKVLDPLPRTSDRTGAAGLLSLEERRKIEEPNHGGYRVAACASCKSIQSPGSDSNRHALL